MVCMLMKSSVSNVPSPFLDVVPWAPTPVSSSSSSSGMSHPLKLSALRRATNTNVGPSHIAPNRSHCVLDPCSPPRGGVRRARTGSYVNQRPNVDQKGASLGRLRILYETITSG